MAVSTLPFSPTQANKVKAKDSLEPRQHKTPPKRKTGCDFYQQCMLKHPYLSEFHSRAELLHAALMEANTAVTSYIPHPFQLWIGRTLYTPDCYVVSDNQSRQVIELRPNGEMGEDKRIPLLHYFAQYGMQFVVISNESVYERKVEAENWLEIVRILYVARDLGTTDAEYTVLDSLFKKGPCQMGEMIDAGDRERTYLQEIALFRLLHRGHIVAELSERPLDFDTGIALCA